MTNDESITIKSITHYWDTDGLGDFSETMDVKASHRRYAELVEETLEELYPEAEITVRRHNCANGGHTIIEAIDAGGEPVGGKWGAVTHPYVDREVEAERRRIETALGSIWESGAWVVEVDSKALYHDSAESEYLVLDEEGENVAGGRLRRVEGERWVYVDDVDGYSLVSAEQAEILLGRSRLADLTDDDIAAIEQRARETAALFVDEFGEPWEPKTDGDWDAESWSIDLGGQNLEGSTLAASLVERLRESDDLHEAAREVWSATFEAETERLCSDAAEQLAESETAAWQHDGEAGETARREIRDRVRERADRAGCHIEIHSHDGVTLDVVYPEAE